MLDDNIPNLLPKLRPYQRRAAYWMVQREKGALGSFGTQGTSQLVSPLCMTVAFVDSGLEMFYNPFRCSFSILSWYYINTNSTMIRGKMVECGWVLVAFLHF